MQTEKETVKESWIVAILAGITVAGFLSSSMTPAVEPQAVSSAYYAKQINGKGYMYSGPYPNLATCESMLPKIVRPAVVQLRCVEG